MTCGKVMFLVTLMSVQLRPFYRSSSRQIHGFQPTLFSQKCELSSRVPSGTSIQIHHNGRHHWVTSTTIGWSRTCQAWIFVSRDVFTVDGNLPPSLECHVTQIYGTVTSTNQLRVEISSVQQQDGDIDCGLFAIAFATEWPLEETLHTCSTSKIPWETTLFGAWRLTRWSHLRSWHVAGELLSVGLLLLHSIVCVDCLKAKTTWWNANNASSGFTTRVWERRAMKRPTSGVALTAYKKPSKLKNLNQFK